MNSLYKYRHQILEINLYLFQSILIRKNENQCSFSRKFAYCNSIAINTSI